MLKGQTTVNSSGNEPATIISEDPQFQGHVPVIANLENMSKSKILCLHGANTSGEVLIPVFSRCQTSGNLIADTLSDLSIAIGTVGQSTRGRAKSRTALYRWFDRD
jgi:hypothetical protein